MFAKKGFMKIKNKKAAKNAKKVAKLAKILLIVCLVKKTWFLKKNNANARKGIISKIVNVCPVFKDA